MQPYWTDGEREVRQGDAWALAGQLAPTSVDCLVTSPPYWGLRDYGVEGQCGLEAHPQEWLEKMVDLFVRLRPALKPTATLWVNLGDTYGFSGKGQGKERSPGFDQWKQATNRGTIGVEAPDWNRIRDGWVRPKQLLMLPERFAITMQDAGFLLRNKVIWAKPNAMPSSARDRLTTKHETVFFFTLGPKYYFDLEAVRVPLAQASVTRLSQPTFDDQTGGPKDGINPNRSARKALVNLQKRYPNGPGGSPLHRGSPDGESHGGQERESNPYGGANPGDFWMIPPAPFPEAHFATFPPQLVERPLKAGCPREVCVECGKPNVREVVAYGGAIGRSWHGHESDLRVGAGQAACLAERRDSQGRAYRRETLGWRPTCDCEAPFVPGLVLDPFLGSGTTLCVAKELGLRGIGFELNPTYCAMAARRIADWRRPKAMVTAEANGQATLFDATAAGPAHAGVPALPEAACSVFTAEVEEVAAG
jgi:site-specific DNA-methyltransferase (cytosine-N4-specific)